MKKRKNEVSFMLIAMICMALAAGSAAGAFAESRIDDSSRNGSMEYINRALLTGNNTNEAAEENSKNIVFKETFKNNGILLLSMSAAGISVVLFPAVFLIMFYKGAALGFSSALVMESVGKGGIVQSLKIFLLPNVIMIPLFILYGYFCAGMALRVIRGKNPSVKRRIFSENVKLFFPAMLVSMLILTAAAAAEAYLNPLLFDASGVIL